MPDSLIAALVITACIGVMPSLYMLFYRLLLKVSFDEARGTVLEREESFKRLKFKGFKREDVTDLPLKALIEFDTSEGKVTVQSRYEYDNEEYDKAFPTKEAGVLYNHKRPDKGYIIKSEYKRHFIKISLGSVIFAMLAVGAEFTVFIYLGMF